MLNYDDWITEVLAIISVGGRGSKHTAEDLERPETRPVQNFQLQLQLQLQVMDLLSRKLLMTISVHPSIYSIFETRKAFAVLRGQGFGTP